MHLPMSYYFLNCSSRSQLCESSGKKKNHVIQGKMNPYKTSCSGNECGNDAYKITNIARTSAISPSVSCC